MIRRKFLLALVGFAGGAYIGYDETPESLQEKTSQQLPIGPDQRFWWGNTMSRVRWDLDREVLRIHTVDNPEGGVITISHVDENAIENALVELEVVPGGGTKEIEWSTVIGRYDGEMDPWQIDLTAVQIGGADGLSLDVEVVQSETVGVPEDLQRSVIPLS